MLLKIYSKQHTTHCAKVKAVNCESVWKVLVGWCQLNILSTAQHSQGPGGETAALELKTEIKSLQRGASNDISSQIPDWQICHTMARRQSYNKFNCTIYPAWFFKCQIWYQSNSSVSEKAVGFIWFEWGVKGIHTERESSKNIETGKVCPLKVPSVVKSIHTTVWILFTTNSNHIKLTAFLSVCNSTFNSNSHNFGFCSRDLIIKEAFYRGLFYMADPQTTVIPCSLVPAYPHAYWAPDQQCVKCNPFSSASLCSALLSALLLLSSSPMLSCFLLLCSPAPLLP